MKSGDRDVTRRSVAFALHESLLVPELILPTPDRRVMSGGDRRRNSRGGRRASDPHRNWRRLAWLFAAYAVYLTLRSLPSMMKSSLPGVIARAVPGSVRESLRKLFRKEPATPA